MPLHGAQMKYNLLLEMYLVDSRSSEVSATGRRGIPSSEPIEQAVLPYRDIRPFDGRADHKHEAVDQNPQGKGYTSHPRHRHHKQLPTKIPRLFPLKLSVVHHRASASFKPSTGEELLMRQNKFSAYIGFGRLC